MSTTAEAALWEDTWTTTDVVLLMIVSLL